MIPQGWLYAVAFAVGLGAGAWLADNALSTEHEQYKASVAKDAEDRALAVLMTLEAAGEKVQAGEAAISKQRDDNAKATELQAAELDRLNRCLKSGTCGLRVAAKCPSVPNTAAGGSAERDTTTGARLAAAAESDYLEYTRKYTEQLNTLRMCKAFGDTQTKKPSQ
jgi:Bacteriophage lysis protein.